MHEAGDGGVLADDRLADLGPQPAERGPGTGLVDERIVLGQAHGHRVGGSTRPGGRPGTGRRCCLGHRFAP